MRHLDKKGLLSPKTILYEVDCTLCDCFNALWIVFFVTSPLLLLILNLSTFFIARLSITHVVSQLSGFGVNVPLAEMGRAIIWIGEL